MQPHVDTSSLSLMDVGHQVHLNEDHCEAARCQFDQHSDHIKRASQEAAGKWVGTYGQEVAERAATVRARRQRRSK